MNHNLQRVSDKIIFLHRERYGESISPMKLQKLCYYAQGFNLAINNKNLFDNDFEAWQHGPVIIELYHEYKTWGWKQIDKDIDESIKEDNPNENDLLLEVVSYFGSYDGSTLSVMTHKEAPWREARGNLADNEASRNLISKESINTYFKRQVSL